MMYTSGTTGPPKGVVLSFSNVHFQVAQIRKAWEWAPADVMLHALPLHHTHGIISGLLTPLYSRAACVMLPKFNPEEVRHMAFGYLKSRSGAPNFAWMLILRHM